MLARQVRNHLNQPCFVLGIFKIESRELFVQAGLESHPLQPYYFPYFIHSVLFL
jgi:hypothetical protein